METENKEIENQEETTTTAPSTDTSKNTMNTKVDTNLNYIDKAAQTGKEGADALKKVEVPKYTPITYKMLKNDPEVRKATPSLIRNAIFKGLEGALSTKASGRQFDPTTRMGQYDDAELQRYTENATDKENTIYQAQKQPIENAISAQAQAGIQTEDAALNSYIQDYTAEKDQNRKFALLNQVMAQAGLTKGVDENGNPIYKDWTELKTQDLLKLNQLMQYLSGDTSVMNLLVGQYGPGIIEKVESLIDWIKGGGNSPKTDNGEEEPVLTPEYSMEDLKTAVGNGDKNAILYKQRNIVEYGDGQWYDIRDTSDAALTSLAQTLADQAVNEGKMYKGVLDEIERKTYEATGKGWFNKNGKNAKQDVSALTDYYIKELQGQKQDDFIEGSDTTSLNVSEYGDIDKAIAQLQKDRKGTSTAIDTEALKTQIDNSTMTDEQKEERKKEIDDSVSDITYNKNKEQVEKDEKEHKEKVKVAAKELQNNLDKQLKKKITKTDYTKKGKYEDALKEAQSIYEALKDSKQPLEVLQGTTQYNRLNDIAKAAYGNGRLAEEDKNKGGLLANFLTYLGDYKHWEE